MAVACVRLGLAASGGCRDVRIRSSRRNHRGGLDLRLSDLVEMVGRLQHQTGIQVNYQSIGSGGGIVQIRAGTVDFGASDAPMQPAELQKLGMGQFPLVIGGIAPVDALNYVPLPESLVKQIEQYWKSQFVGLKG